MNIGVTNIDINLSCPLLDTEDTSLLIGFSSTEGFTECCNDPVIIFEIGILILRLTIIASRNHKH
jgi:hypothetical protein